MKPTTYIIVDELNWHEQAIDADGTYHTCKSHRPPPDLASARKWPGCRIVEAREPPMLWRCGTYTVDSDGLSLVCNDFEGDHHDS